MLAALAGHGATLLDETIGQFDQLAVRSLGKRAEQIARNVTRFKRHAGRSGRCLAANSAAWLRRCSPSLSSRLDT